jgi:hypothetical protein
MAWTSLVCRTDRQLSTTTSLFMPAVWITMNTFRIVDGRIFVKGTSPSCWSEKKFGVDIGFGLLLGLY